jgi:hypothetical protein
MTACQSREFGSFVSQEPLEQGRVSEAVNSCDVGAVGVGTCTTVAQRLRFLCCSVSVYLFH